MRLGFGAKPQGRILSRERSTAVLATFSGGLPGEDPN